MRKHTKTIAYIPRLDEPGILVEGVYRFNKKKRHHWLQRLCLWGLDRLGCQYYQQVTSGITATINFDSIAEMALAQRDAIESIANRRCKYLLLGREQMHHLGIACENFPYQMMFTFPGNRHALFAGMNVILSPWFDGIVCLEDFEEMAY